MSDVTVIEMEGPELYDKQWDALFCDARYSLVEATTKAGKTVGAAAWQTEQVFEHPGEHWWVAPVYTQAEIAYQRVKAMLPDHIYTATDSKRLLVFINGSRWWFKTAEKPDNLYGDDVLSAVIDEASRVRAGSWHAVRSTLTATRAPCRMIGNVRGKNNWFYKLCRRAEVGLKNYHYAKLTAFDAVDAGVLDIREIEDAREALPEAVFKELYLAEASDDGSNPFGSEHIEACTAPLSRDPVVVWGVDLAKDVDWTVIFGLDIYGRCAFFERFQHRPWHEVRATLRELPEGPMLVDSTGVGDPIVEELQRERPGVEGFKFTTTSRQQLLEGLRAGVQEHLLTFPEGPTVAELEACEYAWTRTNGVRYQVFEGMTDDCMMALALAWLHWRNHAHRAPQMFKAERHQGRRAERRGRELGQGETTEKGEKLKLRLQRRRRR